MGRYAQRRISGGGPPPPPDLISITIAHKDSFTQSTLTYSGPISSGDFGAGDFTGTPGGTSVAAIAQGAANQLVLQWDDIETETGLTFDALISGILTPQSIAFS